ncbi:hypothetical protein F4779DRAFT_618581 [Xylariaceae sp. FL0662B]|nr:hypothetical protein F4779DRAFT_618581 [Xylariaceae sp. FL0662B]
MYLSSSLFSAGVVALVLATAAQADFKFYGREFKGKSNSRFDLIACSELETRENCLMYTIASAGTTDQLPRSSLKFPAICGRQNLELRNVRTDHYAVIDTADGGKVADCKDFQGETLGPYSNKQGTFEGQSRLFCSSDLCGKVGGK